VAGGAAGFEVGLLDDGVAGWLLAGTRDGNRVASGSGGK